MDLIRKIIFMLTVMFTLTSVYSLQVVETTTNTQPEPTNSLAVIVIIIMLTTGLAFVLLVGFLFILMKIWNKLTEFNRKKKDFIYYMFEDDDTQCHANHDTEMKKRNWKFLWLFWKRTPVYINTKDGLKVIGHYNGESDKKENFYLISVYNKLGAFKMFTRIIIIPNTLKFIVKKINVNGTKILILDCENIDRIMNTDYYYIPLVKDVYDSEKYLDFADMVYEHYIEKSTYRDLIKENLMQYRDGVIKAVESNVSLQMNRRKQ